MPGLVLRCCLGDPPTFCSYNIPCRQEAKFFPETRILDTLCSRPQSSAAVKTLCDLQLRPFILHEYHQPVSEIKTGGHPGSQSLTEVQLVELQLHENLPVFSP